MEFSRTRDPAWRREGAEGRILAKSCAFSLNLERVSRKTDETKIPGKGKGRGSHRVNYLRQAAAPELD